MLSLIDLKQTQNAVLSHVLGFGRYPASVIFSRGWQTYLPLEDTNLCHGAHVTSLATKSILWGRGEVTYIALHAHFHCGETSQLMKYAGRSDYWLD